MTLKASLYDQLSREELIRLLEARDNEPDNAEIYISSETPTIKRIISEVLAILFNEENKPIEKAMNLLLGYFNADWGYVAIFEEDGFAANFTCEVMSSWVKIPKDDRNKLTCDTIPWIIDTVKAGHDIVLGDIAGLPAEADIDKILLTEQQLKSMLIVPLTFHNKVQGFIGFDSIRTSRFWTASEVEDMHIIAGIFSIIIERWQTNYNLEESRKRISKLSTKFQQFFNNLPIGVELYDAEGYLIDINDADTKIFGSSREQLLGVNLFKNPAVPERILNQIKKKKAFSFPLAYDFNCIRDTRYYNSNISDEVKYLMVKGIGLNDREFGHIGYLLIISDETEKQAKEEQTQNNLAILKAVLLSGHSLIAEYDIEKKELFVNPLLNETPEDNKLFNYLRNNRYMTIGSVQQIIRSDDNVNLLFQVIEGKQDHCSFECRTAIENETIWIRINAQAYKTKGSKRQNKMICHITNITEEKLLEEKLHHAEYETRQSELEIQKVREADKLKSAFLANMSHEIRTPLNAIVGFSNLLPSAETLEEEKLYSSIINQNSEILLQLINDILDLSKIEAGTLEYVRQPMNLGEVCRNIYQIHKDRVQEGVTLILDNEDDDLIIEEDRNRIAQVITNFLTNAGKFTLSGEIRFGFKVDNQCIRFYVKDTGIGIAPDKVGHIFDRFVKLNSFAQGTGLGLAICRMIIEKIGGEIGATSEVGKGSTFFFTIPYKESSDDRITYSDTSEAKYLSHTIKRMQKIKKILVAEDVDSNFVLIKNMIGKDYTLLWAKDGFEAVEMYKQFQPDLILMDIKMPRMGGLEATRIIRSYSKEIPVIALTAYAFEADKEQALEAGCNDFVTKPVSKAALEEALGKCSG